MAPKFGVPSISRKTNPLIQLPMRLIDCFSPLISFALHSRSVTHDDGSDFAELHQQFLNFAEQSRKLCDEHGFSQPQGEDGLFAVVAWIDEQRFSDTDQDTGHWLSFELQRTLFNTSSAGDEFYQRFQAIAETDKQLREVFAYCLCLGFRGRLFDEPESFEEFCRQSFGCSIEDMGSDLPDILFAGGYNPADEIAGARRFKFLPSGFSFLIFLIPASLLGGLFLFCQRSLWLLYSSLKTTGL